ncbi:m7GpppN-mRNA hydrolase [Coccinella septempunctata]|uniref:m7GpppN-mRNA hydrolase n=1 Tax=Coccinella septempunctata TaxID=41139 RepID=UPI001D096035|nr:m7GpppN-mRNA hydrolase [Coccinella septempunctata]
MEEAKKVEHSIPTEILDDLLTRFLINVPESAKKDYVRICFQIENAHWYYLDFYVSNDSNLKSCTIYEFATHVFQHSPFLQKELYRLPEIMAEWKQYKQTVPTYGAILLSEGLSHVLLVKSYWTKTSWGFPKGKVNEEESPVHCAIREVLEETGFDITSYVDPEDWVEAIINEQLVRLYIIKNIPMSTKFQPKTRCEIKSVGWFSIADLPTNRKDLTPKLKLGVNPNAFYLILPFVKKLKQLSNCATSNKRSRKKSNSLSDCENSVSKHKSRPNVKTEEEKGKINKKTERKNVTKRELFPNMMDQLPELNGASCWVNFKFDQTAIIECIP